MSGEEGRDNRFGVIAVEMNFVDQKKVDKALVVQTRIFDKTRVEMPIGEILVEMGAITSDERAEILQMQVEIERNTGSEESRGEPQKKRKSIRSPKKEGSNLDINVSKDKLTASAYIDGDVPVTEFNVNDVKVMLHSDSIIFGIADDSQIEAFLNGEFSVGERWIFATGTKPIPDSPPEIKFHFDTDSLKIGTLTEDGLMDWKNRGQLPQVKEGDLLAEKIPIQKIRERRFKCGKGSRRSEDGLQVHTSLSGIPKHSLIGEISVMPTLHIQGDIALETGHVEFDGHIEVAGAVEKGYKVKGKSLQANEIRDAEIDIEGDINSVNGIFGATIRSGGNLKAGHIHNSDIIIAGDMAVEKEIIESKMETNGRCLIIDGIIISSTVSAKMGIIAMDIGTAASKSSDLIVGIDQQTERELEAITEKIQKTIKALKARQDSYDQDVATLMEADESISQEITATQTAIIESSTKIQELNERLDVITESRKRDNGVAVVKIGGNIYTGTKFTGPHSTLVLQENLRRLSIAETDKQDQEGVKRWRFKLNPFR